LRKEEAPPGYGWGLLTFPGQLQLYAAAQEALAQADQALQKCKVRYSCVNDFLSLHKHSVVFSRFCDLPPFITAYRTIVFTCNILN
jgi:hypothetical protein